MFQTVCSCCTFVQALCISKSPGTVEGKELSRFYSPDAVLVIGLGKLRNLDDELLMQVLSLLPADSLGQLACVNRALYCFSNHDDLWRALTLEASQINSDLHHMLCIFQPGFDNKVFCIMCLYLLAAIVSG